jgi:thioredoxin:protein disulfide reductase
MKTTKMIFKIGAALLVHAALFAEVPLTVKTAMNPDPLPAGGLGTLVVTCSIKPGVHISAPSVGFFMAAMPPVSGMTWGEPVYPKGVVEEYGEIYRGEIVVQIPVTAAVDASPGTRQASVELTVQPCGEKEGVCFPPETLTSPAAWSVASASGSSSSGGLTSRLESALAVRSFWAFVLIFLGGVLTSLTPCVYPMIPITIAVISGQSGGNKLRGFTLSVFYVLGLAATFSILGVIAARTGAVFGSFTQNPVVIVLIASIFFLMGLSLLGVFVLQMPPAIASKLRSKKRSGFLGAFVTGLLAGLVVSPCISPLLVVILTWVAKMGSTVLGFGMLFTFALGLGVLFILIGTFSGILKALPRSGGWMGWIEKGFGLALVVLAVFMLKPAVPHWIFMLVWSALFVTLGVFAGAFEQTAAPKSRWSRALGIWLVVIGAALALNAVGERFAPAGTSRSVSAVSSSEKGWLTSVDEALAQGRATGRPVLADFFADWCAACRELDEKTWPDPAVKKGIGGFIPVRLDMTKSNEATDALRKRFRIVGLPTVMALDTSGRELGRLEGFHGPEEMAAFLNRF